MTAVRSWLLNTRVRNKILFGFSLVLLFMLAVLVSVMVQTQRIASFSQESRRAAEIELQAAKLDVALTARIAAFRDYLGSGQPEALEAFRDADNVFQTRLSELDRLVEGEARRALLDTVRVRSVEWMEEVARPGIELRQAVSTATPAGRDSLEAAMRSGLARRGADRAIAALDELEREEAAIVTERQAHRDAALESLRWMTVIFTVLALAISFMVATILAGHIAASLERAVAFAASVAEGDLTGEVEMPTRDEVGVMIGTLNRMTSDLRRTVGSVSATSGQVASAAEEIAAAAQQISYTADQQVRSTEETSASTEQIAAQIARVSRSAESLAVSVDQTSSSIGQMSNAIEQTAASAEALGTSVEETSTTIEQMSASMSEVGRHVEETRVIARDAANDARVGGDAVGRSVEGMQRIHSEIEELVQVMRELGSTSEAVGRISEVIEDIADQTNLLALNAAIEAARAGEHGRGFAVVAGEIRRLAERSVESSREIGTTIRSVIDDVHKAVTTTGDVAQRTQDGIALADSAGSALEKIIDSSGRTRELMDEVALATDQQIGAARQAQDAISHILRVAAEMRLATREQASGTRQIVDAVANMNRQTQEVFSATEEQKRGGEMILEATENINQGARSTQEAIQEMANASQELSSQATRLSELVATFRV